MNTLLIRPARQVDPGQQVNCTDPEFAEIVAALIRDQLDPGYDLGTWAMPQLDPGIWALPQLDPSTGQLDPGTLVPRQIDPTFGQIDPGLSAEPQLDPGGLELPQADPGLWAQIDPYLGRARAQIDPLLAA